MNRKQVRPEQIFAKLRKAAVELAEGTTATVMCQRLGVSALTDYHWRKEQVGFRIDQEKRPRRLERENARLREVMADQALDNAIVSTAATKATVPTAAHRRRFCATRSESRNSLPSQQRK